MKRKKNAGLSPALLFMKISDENPKQKRAGSLIPPFPNL